MGRACGVFGGNERCVQDFCWGNLRERDHLEDRGVDGRIMLNLMFKKLDGEARTGLTSLRIGEGRGLL